jgi:hypothetical protein
LAGDVPEVDDALVFGIRRRRNSRRGRREQESQSLSHAGDLETDHHGADDGDGRPERSPASASRQSAFRGRGGVAFPHDPEALRTEIEFRPFLLLKGTSADETSLGFWRAH